MTAKEKMQVLDMIEAAKREQIEKDARLIENVDYLRLSDDGLLRPDLGAEIIRSQLPPTGRETQCPKCQAPWGNDCDQFGCWNCGTTGKEE